MKAPAFLFYAGDFLASPDVQSMDTREVGAYVLLLLNAWQGDLPGHLPNNEDRLRRITRMTVAEWEVSRELLLGKFPVADLGHTRYNPRMVAEAEKQMLNRAKKAAAGKQGGRPAKKQTESEIKQMLSEEKHMLSKGKANGKQTESLSISITETTNVVEKATTPVNLPASKTPKELAALLCADNDLLAADEVPMLNDLRLFSIVADRYGYTDCDKAFYMREIRGTALSKDMKAGVAQFESFIKSYLKNEKGSKNGLVKLGATVVPMQKSDKEIQFELNPTAVARRRREAEEATQRVIAANLERINRNEGTNFQPAGIHPGTVQS